MCTKWRYNICICSVILGQLESFRNYKALSIIFQEQFRYNFKVYERSAKIIVLFMAFSNPKILGFRFMRN